MRAEEIASETTFAVIARVSGSTRSIRPGASPDDAQPFRMRSPSRVATMPL